MSLDWSVSKVNNYETVCFDEDEKLRAITEALVFGAMMIDVGGINKANIDEWHFRISFLKSIGVTWLERYVPNGSPESVYPSYDDIADHLGLRTNVTTLARQKWIRQTIRRHELNIEKDIAWEMKQREETQS